MLLVEMWGSKKALVGLQASQQVGYASFLHGSPSRRGFNQLNGDPRQQSPQSEGDLGNDASGNDLPAG